MPSTDDRRVIRFWRPDSPSVEGMFRLEHEDRNKVTYTEHFSIVVVYDGAFDGRYRSGVRTHVAGSVKLNEPGEVHRAVRVHTPFTLQGVAVSRRLVAAAGDALGLRGSLHFKASGCEPGSRGSRLAFAMHDVLVRKDATEMERETALNETLAEVLGTSPPEGRAPRAVRRALDYLHDALANRITLDDLADYAALDKFHLVRAFRSEVGLPPYEYLTYLRVSRARELLAGGARVAEAAQAVGFCDESQLHRHFRRIVGVSPGVYARSFGPAVRTSQHRPRRAPRRDAPSVHDEATRPQ